MSEELTARVTQAVKQAWDEGCPVAGPVEFIVPVAIRRWQSSSRRKIRAVDTEARVKDLSKGLIERFEAEPSTVGPLRSDYDYLAAKIAAHLTE